MNGSGMNRPAPAARMGKTLHKGADMREQLTKMRARMEKGTRICIVGAGPSGLSAAYALAKLSYHNITVLEKKNKVGGMCESVEIEGRTYDIGGQVLALESAPNMRELIRELNVEMEDMSNHSQALIDCSNGLCQDLKVAEDYISFIPQTLQLQKEAEKSGKLGVHALSNLAPETTQEFLSKRGAPQDLPKAISASFTASGYGFLKDMPYAYVHEFGRTFMLGKVQRVKGGYAGLWKKLAEHYVPLLKCNMEVIHIQRCDDFIKVLARNIHTNIDETFEFDYIFLTGALPYITLQDGTYRSSSPPKRNQLPHLLDFTPTEKALFSKVKIIEYYTTVIKISQLNLKAGFYFFKQHLEDPQTIGHIVAIQRFFSDTDIYVVWSYGNLHIDQQHVIKFLFKDIGSIGGQIDEVILQQRWNYSPHVSSQEMSTNFFDKLEALQGQNNTFYLGALFAFELTELVVAYSMDVVGHFFGTDEEPPVKSLEGISLEDFKEREAYLLDEFTELPGVLFPDFPCVDDYLVYYSHHDIFKDRVLYTWLDENGKETEKRTYAELDERATIIADHLLASKYKVGPQDCVLLLYPPGLDFIEAFIGCLRAQVLAIPLMPPEPGKASQALAKVWSVTEKCHPKIILSTVSYHSVVSMKTLKEKVLKGRQRTSEREPSNAKWPDLPWLHTDSLLNKNGSKFINQILCYFLEQASTFNLQRLSLKKLPAVALRYLSSQNGLTESKNALIENAIDPSLDENVESVSILTSLRSNKERISSKLRDVCFLQFTSGSTGDSKGVLITHGGLIHNVKLMRSKFKSTSQTVLVSWLPQYHDMGLIGGLLTSMVSGGTSVLFSPVTFIRKPMLWLEAMSKYHATHSAAPNFAYELIVRRLEIFLASGKDICHIDLKSVKFLMSSAEPIRPKTLKRFLELLKITGIKEKNIAPGYGLAENCVFVCCAYGKGKPIILDWENRVCCGYVERGNKDADVRIVNPESFEEMPDGVEGEVWVSSPSLGAGYWGETELGQSTFRNKIKHMKPPVNVHSEFLRTGDLGRIMDGLLFITGRIKDLIIIRGRNIYPSDVEKTAESCSQDLRPGCCAAVSAPSKILQQKGIPVEELEDDVGLVVIAEVRDQVKGDYKGLELHIKSTIASEHGIQGVIVCLIKPRTIPKTSSGKIRRKECFLWFINNQLQIVSPINSLESLPVSNIIGRSENEKIVQGNINTKEHEVRTLPTPYCDRLSITEFLIAAVSEKAKIPKTRISTDAKLDSYGIDSIGIVWIAQKLSNFLGVHVAAIDIFTAGCISGVIDVVERLIMERNMTMNIEAHGGIGNSEHPKTAKKLELELVSHYLLDSDFSFAREPALARRVGITALQCVSFLFMAFFLTTPAILLCHILALLISKFQIKNLILLTTGLVPVGFILYIASVGLTLSLLGKILQLPRYSLHTFIPLWSIEYVRWWTFYRLQDFASQALAIHLRGTVFLSWWFRALGAYIGNGVNLDTTDITDPSLLTILDGASIGEGVTLQSHEVRDCCVQLQPIRIGRRACLEPFSFISKGTNLQDGAKVPALGKRPAYKPKDAVTKTQNFQKTASFLPFVHLLGLYIVGITSTVAATVAAAYLRWSLRKLEILPKDSAMLRAYHDSNAEYVLFPLATILPWYLTGVFPLAYCQNPKLLFNFLIGLIFEGKLIPFFGCIGSAYMLFGLALWALTYSLKKILIGKIKEKDDITLSSSLGFRVWLVQRLIGFLHSRFTNFLAGTYMMNAYLISLGACIGPDTSIQRINSITDPDMVDVGERCHLGDHANVITSSSCVGSSLAYLGKVKLGNECVVGAHSVLMPNSTLEDRAWLGALSAAAQGSILEKGGIYVGVEPLIKVHNHCFKENRILGRFAQDEDKFGLATMDPSYLQAVSKVAEQFTEVSSSLQKRGLHQTGVAAKGTIRMMEDLLGLPEHNIFFPGRTLSVLLRHSNAISIEDDAFPDVRGAGLRILEPTGEGTSLDLIMKTGQAFYVRSIADQLKWFQLDEKGKEEMVKNSPDIGKAMCDSRRETDSYTKLHYYSNVCRHLRPSSSTKEADNSEYYVKFRLRPEDRTYGENYGEIDPEINPPTIGSLPRRPGDTRPFSCLADDFKQRVLAPKGVHYILQMQIQLIPDSFSERDVVLDCTKPWNEEDFPYRDVACLHLNEILPDEATETLTLNHKNSTHSLDLILAKSATESASIDHGRSLIYSMLQSLRTGKEADSLPGELSKSKTGKIFIQPVSPGNCPVICTSSPANGPIAAPAAPISNIKDQDTAFQNSISSVEEKTSQRKRAKTPLLLTMLLGLQPFLQVILPVTLLTFVNYSVCLIFTYVGLTGGTYWTYILIPLAYQLSGLLFCVAAVSAKWITVGHTRETTLPTLRNIQTVQETTWHCINSLAASYFLELTRGSALCCFYFRSLGASIAQNVYMDTLFALNPDLLKVQEGSAIGRNALLFGHLYEGREVIYKGNEVGSYACIGGRALALPGSKMEDGSELEALSLGMKDEIISR